MCQTNKAFEDQDFGIIMQVNIKTNNVKLDSTHPLALVPYTNVQKQEHKTLKVDVMFIQNFHHPIVVKNLAKAF